jgi:folate-dependent tRNA-U54 methylase TrmFO/GidA
MDFQPMKANFSVLTSLDINSRMDKNEGSKLFG